MQIKDIILTDAIAKELAYVYIKNIYGADSAEQQKPYETLILGEIWIIKGTKPKHLLGGTFEIHLSKDDGRVVKIGHSR